jgi:hypothetical protein
MPKAAQGCAICTFTLPSGRRCGAIALRGRAFCYHHDRSRRRIAQGALDVKLARYRRELDAMDLPRLLNALLEKLDRIHAIVPAYPEVQLILAVATSRLAILLSNYFDDAAAASPEGIPSPHSAMRSWSDLPIPRRGTQPGSNPEGELNHLNPIR